MSIVDYRTLGEKMNFKETLKNRLVKIYGENSADHALGKILPVVESYRGKINLPAGNELFSERDAVLITYGDSILPPEGSGRTSLAELDRIIGTHLAGLFSAVHILPFFPFSSDDGFSVIDYKQVNPELGSWSDVEKLSGRVSLMFDLVLNHISAKSGWFEKYLKDEPGLENLAIEVDPNEDLSGVTRPRALPLLTKFVKADGSPVHLWTTFSEDQIDLNYADPQVLALMLDVLLSYLEKGARIIRLDAVAYLWKEIGTSCIHLPQAHEVVRLFRDVFDRLAPGAIIITETNVPHAENISYFGNGSDEAQMVYNFTLPPLLLHTFLKGSSRDFRNWISGLSAPSERTTFFNFSASHDGIGVRPLEGILPREDVQALADHAIACGGRVSLKNNPDGSQSPYELNVTYVDAMGRGPDDHLHVERFLASQAIQLAVPGVPAVYVHSVLGSRNWNEGVAQTGRARTINRERLDSIAVEKELADGNSFRTRVFKGYSRLLEIRRSQAAFHPNSAAEYPDLGDGIVAIIRGHGDEKIICLVNVTECEMFLNLNEYGQDDTYIDIITGQEAKMSDLEVKPYQGLWLRKN